MEIQGPVAEADPAPRAARTGGCLAGCASGCASAAGLALLVLGSALGTGFELLQPHHQAAATVPDGSCRFEWWRAALGGARYRITCEARRELTLERFKLLSGPRGVELVESVEDWGQRPWEDQRPLSGQTLTVRPGRTWVYDGSIALGTIPWVGPPATVTLQLVVDDEPLTLRAPEAGR